MMVVSKEVDREFYDAIASKPDEWKMRAIAGLTTREFYGEDPRTHDWAKQHGLSRAYLPSEREAWLFGWEWPEHALLRARATVLDLLMGRIVRARAAEELEVGIHIERCGAPSECVDQQAELAAHYERVACRTEQGQIMWGGRFNRCGQLEVVDAE